MTRTAHSVRPQSTSFRLGMARRLLLVALSFILLASASVASPGTATTENPAIGEAGAISNSHARLRRAMASREEAATQTGALESLLSEDAEFSRHLEQLEATARLAQPLTWEARAFQQRIAGLIRQREQKVLRGGIEAFHAAAEIDWELRFVHERFLRVGHPAELLPENEFEFLPPDTLRDLEARYTAKNQSLSKFAATRPALNLATAIEQGAQKLLQIRAALERPGVDLAARFYKNLPRPKGDADIRWAKNRLRNRDQEIAIAERQQLELALAKDGYDIAVARRLDELTNTDGKRRMDAQQVAFRRRTLAMERAAGFRPPTNTSRLAARMLKDRYQDPLRAVAAESVLRLQFQELLDMSDVRLRALLLPEPLASSFQDWITSHLSDEDLVEVKAYLQESHEWWQRMDGQVPLELQSRRDLDRHTIQSEFDAVQRELEYRSVQGRSRAPTVEPRSLPRIARVLLERHGTMSAIQTLNTRPGKQANYEALQAYMARATPTAEAQRLLDNLYRDGMATELTGLERDVGHLTKLQSEHVDQYRKVDSLQPAGVLSRPPSVSTPESIFDASSLTSPLRSRFSTFGLAAGMNTLDPVTESFRDARSKLQSTLSRRCQLIRAGLRAHAPPSDGKTELETRLARVEDKLRRLSPLLVVERPVPFSLFSAVPGRLGGVSSAPPQQKPASPESNSLFDPLQDFLPSDSRWDRDVRVEPVLPPVPFGDSELGRLRQSSSIGLLQLRTVSAQSLENESIRRQYAHEFPGHTAPERLDEAVRAINQSRQRQYDEIAQRAEAQRKRMEEIEAKIRERQENERIESIRRSLEPHMMRDPSGREHEMMRSTRFRGGRR